MLAVVILEGGGVEIHGDCTSLRVFASLILEAAATDATASRAFMANEGLTEIRVVCEPDTGPYPL